MAVVTVYEPVGKAASRRRGKPSEMTLREMPFLDARPMTARCLDCDWTHEGTAAEGREAWQVHRGAEHPERPARVKRSRGKFVAVKS